MPRAVHSARAMSSGASFTVRPLSLIHILKQNVRDWTDEEAVEAYLRALLHREAFDRAGLIYGMGHAVSVSYTHLDVYKRQA